MTVVLPPLRLTGAMALRDGRMQNRTVAISDRRISAGPFPEVDLSGFLILPGIVDLYHVSSLSQATYPGSADGGITELDQGAASHGVTTRLNSLPWSWECASSSPEMTLKRIAILSEEKRKALTDLRIQICADTHMVDTGEILSELSRRKTISAVLFKDSVAEARDLRQHHPEGFIRWSSDKGRKPEEMADALDHAIAGAERVPRHLCSLAELFDEMGTLYGSIGDRNAEAREHLSMIGARLCVDPAVPQVAAAANAVGDPVLFSAELFLNPSLAGSKLDPVDLVRRGQCRALVSGGHSASLVHAAFHLADIGVMPFSEAWRLVSAIPAQIMRLPDRGEIAQGRRADLTIINATTRAVEATIAGGCIAFLSGEAATRFIGMRRYFQSLAAE